VATFSIWPATNGPGSGAADTASTDLGTEFYVTAPGCNFDGYKWWCATGTDTTATNYSFRLYSTTDGLTGTLIAGTTIAGTGTFTAGAWNFVLLGASVPLTANVRYRAVITHSAASNHYSASASWWTADVVNGPLTAPSQAHALNTTQSSFNEPSTGGMPTSSSGANYWLDVQIDTGATAVPHAAQAPVPPAWQPDLPGVPGAVPFTWAALVAPGPVPPPPVIIPATPGTYSGIPGRAVPGLFIPGNPGPVPAQPPVTELAQFGPAWHPGDGLPGMPGGIPFLAVPQGAAQPAPAAGDITGSGGLTFAVPLPLSTGTEEFAGTGGLTVPAPTFAGTGSEAFAGTGNVTVPALTLSGSAGGAFTGSGSLTVPSLTLAGTGSETFTGSGTVIMPGPLAAGTAAEAFTGSGGVMLPLLTVKAASAGIKATSSATVTAVNTSTAAVTDPRDGTAAVTAITTSSSGVT
jgi:uncharacterized protein DUF4082